MTNPDPLPRVVFVLSRDDAKKVHEQMVDTIRCLEELERKMTSEPLDGEKLTKIQVDLAIELPGHTITMSELRRERDVSIFEVVSDEASFSYYVKKVPAGFAICVSNALPSVGGGKTKLELATREEDIVPTIANSIREGWS